MALVALRKLDRTVYGPNLQVAIYQRCIPEIPDMTAYQNTDAADGQRERERPPVLVPRHALVAPPDRGLVFAHAVQEPQVERREECKRRQLHRQAGKKNLYDASLIAAV